MMTKTEPNSDSNLFSSQLGFLLEICLTIFFLTSCFNVSGQSQGPTAGSSASNMTLAGSASVTINVNNALVSDNNYASNSIDLAGNGNYSDYIMVTGYGFSVPNGSTISGIEVDIERSDVNNKIKDNIVSLIKSGTITGNNKASNVGWPSTDASVTYGNSSDLWGTTWTVSDINSSSFGVAFSWKRSGGGSSSAYARIDVITIKVYYTASLPIELVSFSVLPLFNEVRLNWTTSSEVNNNYFLVQRSHDLESMTEIAVVSGGGNSSAELNYFAADTNPPEGISYYRLKQIDFNGQSSYSKWVRVTMKEKQELKIIPNPIAGNTLDIILPAVPSLLCRVSISDIRGRIVFEKKITKDVPTDFLSIANIPFLSDGLYFLKAEIDGTVYDKKFQVQKP